MKLSNSNLNVITAYDIGFRVVDGNVISPYTGKFRALDLHRTGYYRFSINVGKRTGVVIMVHKLVAYQKFGLSAFQPGTEVRHLDGDSLNNLIDNIAIGTIEENANDKSPEVRFRSSVVAATKLRKFTDEEMDQIRRFHNGSYKETMTAFGITSKATLHRILNVKYKTRL